MSGEKYTYETLKKRIDQYVKNDAIAVKNLKGLRLYVGVSKTTFNNWRNAPERYNNQTYDTENDTSFRRLIEDAYDSIENDLLQSGTKVKNSVMQMAALNHSFGYYRESDESAQGGMKVTIELPKEMEKYAK